MTAPAPGLPQDVERALTEAITRAASIGYDGAPDDKYFGGEALDVALDRAMESDKTAALRAAIAAHVAPGGESVAWQIVARDGTPAIAYASLDSAMEHIGPGETMRPLFTRPAPPVSASFEAALAALDVEPTHIPAKFTTTYDILGLDDVRAAHRAEVDAIRKERDEAVALLANAILRVQSCVTHSAELEKEYADGGYTESAAICRRQREEDNALLMRMDAAIRKERNEAPCALDGRPARIVVYGYGLSSGDEQNVRARANARAIVTLRNAAPQVAALVEAAGALFDPSHFYPLYAETDGDVCVVCGANDFTADQSAPFQHAKGCRWEAVRAALDALARAARDATSGPADPTRIEGSPK